MCIEIKGWRDGAVCPKQHRIIRAVGGIGPGATEGARKLAERRAEKLARWRRKANARTIPTDWRTLVTDEDLTRED